MRWFRVTRWFTLTKYDAARRFLTARMHRVIQQTSRRSREQSSK
jgi:hypothetical protein